MSITLSQLPPVDGATPLAGVGAPAGATKAQSASSTPGPATTFWFSPPGQYLSLLHRVGSLYPVELMTALRMFAEGVSGPAGAPDAVTFAHLADEIESGGRPARARAETGRGAAPTPHAAPPAAPGSGPSSVGRLLESMVRVAQINPAAFPSIAAGLAASVASVPAAGGAGVAGMATLAAQLQVAAQMPDRGADSLRGPFAGDDPSSPAEAAAPVIEVAPERRGKIA